MKKNERTSERVGWVGVGGFVWEPAPPLSLSLSRSALSLLPSELSQVKKEQVPQSQVPGAYRERERQCECKKGKHKKKRGLTEAGRALAKTQHSARPPHPLSPSLPPKDAHLPTRRRRRRCRR